MTQGQKIPKRFWWTKRIFVAWLLMLAVLPITRTLWTHLSEQRLADEIAAIQARGERLDWLNMSPPRLPAEQNAAVYYQQAFTAILPLRQAAQGSLLNDLSAIPSFRAKHAAEVEAMLTAHAAVFDLCRQARSMPGTDWGMIHAHPAFNSTFRTQYWTSRNLAKLLRLRAVWQAEHGDSAGAIETLRDMEALGRATSAGDSTMFSLASTGIYRVNVQAIEEVTPRLTITASPAATQPADPQAMRALIAELLVDHSLTAMREMMITGRASMNDVVEWVIEGGNLPAYTNSAPGGIMHYLDPQVWGNPQSPSLTMLDQARCWWLKPIYRDDQRHILMLYSQMVAMLSQPTMAKSEQFAPVNDFFSYPMENNIRHWLRPLSRLILPGYGQLAYTGHSGVVERRMAATALALRLFELEKGRSAESLEQLVPEYLPAVPQDPFDPAEGPIRALLTDAMPRLYSLGENKIDDGGTSPTRGSGNPSDIVFFLRPGGRPEEASRSTPSQPASSPSTAAGNPNPQ